MKKELVSKWMSKEPVTVSLETSLPEAHQIMLNNKIRRLPVTNEDGEILGIITLGDVRGALPSPATSLSIWEMNYLLSSLKVDAVMTKEPVTIHPEQTIGEAARLMLENRISGLPVVDETGCICGIITESDIFSMIVLHEWSEE